VIGACDLMAQVMRRRLARMAELHASLESQADPASAQVR